MADRDENTLHQLKDHGGRTIQSFSPNVTESGALVSLSAEEEKEITLSNSLHVFFQPKTNNIEVRLSSGNTNSMTVTSGEKWGYTVGPSPTSIFIYSALGTNVAVWKDKAC